MVQLLDPLEGEASHTGRIRVATDSPEAEALRAVKEHRKSKGMASAAETAGVLPQQQRRNQPKALSKEEAAKVREDFRLFMVIMWRHLNLPDPTPIQLSMAHYLQHGPERCIIEGFRGVAKSWITSAFVLWLLWRDPQQKVLVVSASLKRAVAFTQFCLTLIREMPMLVHLAPTPKQRQSSTEFDVRGATPDQSASLTARGVNGQLTGTRADGIVGDDVEISTNSLTVVMRDKIREQVKEFDSIIKPGGWIKYLGTPHTEDCLYDYLVPRGYSVRIWPALFPNREERERYGAKLAPFILQQLQKDASRVGHSTEPSRFTDEDLGKRRLSLGDSEFTLQFLLDTSLSDRDKYPLKLKELMVLPLDAKRGPSIVTWGMGETKKHLPSMGFGGDYLHAPAFSSLDARPPEVTPYSRIIASCDISGRGNDETCMVVMGELNAMLFAIGLFASREGYSADTLNEMAGMCVRYNVHQFYYESNFGDGMFGALFRVQLQKAWDKANSARKPDEHGGTEMMEIKTGNQVYKEKRILSVLEPTTQAHRLVLSEDFIQQDYKLTQAIPGEETRHKYSLMWQYTHLTRERNSLPNDDRLETLSMAVAPFAEGMGIDPVGMAIRAKQEKDEQELQDLFDEADEVGGSPVGRHKSDRHVTNAARPSKR